MLGKGFFVPLCLLKSVGFGLLVCTLRTVSPNPSDFCYIMG